MYRNRSLSVLPVLPDMRAWPKPRDDMFAEPVRIIKPPLSLVLAEIHSGRNKRDLFCNEDVDNEATELVKVDANLRVGRRLVPELELGV